MREVGRMTGSSMIVNMRGSGLMVRSVSMYASFLSTKLELRGDGDSSYLETRQGFLLNLLPPGHLAPLPF